jgi:hypothetical protein
MTRALLSRAGSLTAGGDACARGAVVRLGFITLSPPRPSSVP